MSVEPSFQVSIAEEHPDIADDSPNKCRLYLTITNKRMYNYATINAIRRAIHSYITIWGFDQHLDEGDHKFLLEHFGIKHLSAGHTRLTTVVDTTEFVMVALSHRMSRIPIMTSEQTNSKLQSSSTRLVYFLICQGIDDKDDKKDFTPEWHSHPYVNEHNITKRIRVRDLIPAVYTRATETDAWAYNAGESEILHKMRNQIFPYDVPLISVGLGKKVHVVLKPSKGKMGVDNSQYCPCIPRYRFIADSRWHKEMEQGPIEARTARDKEDGARENTIRRKVQDEMGFKQVMLTDYDKFQATDEKEPYDKMGQPYGIQLVVEYNGKMSVVDATLSAVRALKDGVDLFQQYYFAVDNVVHKEFRKDTQNIYIPRNTEDKLVEKKPETKILVDDTIANMLKFKMLEIMDKVIGEETVLWARTLIAYKIPHELIPQCVYTISLPLHEITGETNQRFIDKLKEHLKLTDEILPNELGLFHQELIRAACNGVRDDLRQIAASIRDAAREQEVPIDSSLDVDFVSPAAGAAAVVTVDDAAAGAAAVVTVDEPPV